MIDRVVKTVVMLSVTVFFCAVLFANVGKAFDCVGVIRAVVVETEAPREDNAFFPGIKFVGPARSKVEYYFVKDGLDGDAHNEKWIKLPDDRSWSSWSNRRVRLEGVLKKGSLSNVAIVDRLEKEPLVWQPTTGLYKIVAVPLTIQPSGGGQASLTVTPEAIRDTFFNTPKSVNNFYREASYEMLSFRGVHHPQIDVVPATVTATISGDCQNQIITEFTPIARQRLLEQNIDTTNGSVDLGVIIFNDVAGCPPYPFATRGALGTRGAPLWVWIPESWFVTGPAIVAHEMGHAFGGNHPVSVRCSNFDDLQTCVYVEANDRNMMTAAGQYYVMPSNYERRRWGWHPPWAFMSLSPNFSQEYDLRSPSVVFAKDGFRSGRFYFRPLGGVYSGYEIYPESRRNWGRFEQYTATDDAYRSGVTVRKGHVNFTDPEARSALLDPNSTPTNDDSPLRVNQSLTIGGVTITCRRESNPGWGTRMFIQQ